MANSPHPHVIKLLDHFEYRGENGMHLCLILELMWDNVSNFFQGYGADPNIRLALTKTVTKQLINGLKFMDKCGVIHNGINFSLHL